MQRVVERFQTAYPLEDKPKSGRPHSLSEENQKNWRNTRTGIQEYPHSALLKNAVTNVKPTYDG